MSEHSPLEVRRQIWESLVSMLRVYAHAASLNGSGYIVTTPSDAACIQHGESALRICFSPETGAASWRLTQEGREERGAFEIEDDGTLNFPSGPKPLDEAAIGWVEELRLSSPMNL